MPLNLRVGGDFSWLKSIQDWIIERRGKYLMPVLQYTFLAGQEAILYMICPLLSMEYASPMRGTSMRRDFGRGQSQRWSSQIHSSATSNALHLWRIRILAISSLSFLTLRCPGFGWVHLERFANWRYSDFVTMQWETAYSGQVQSKAGHLPTLWATVLEGTGAKSPDLRSWGGNVR